MTTPSIAGGAGGAEAVGELEGAEHVDAAGAGPVGAIAGGHGIGGGLDEAAEGIRAGGGGGADDAPPHGDDIALRAGVREAGALVARRGGGADREHRVVSGGVGDRAAVVAGSRHEQRSVLVVG